MTSWGAAAREEAPVAVDVAVELWQDGHAVEGGGESQQVAHRLVQRQARWTGAARDGCLRARREACGGRRAATSRRDGARLPLRSVHEHVSLRGPLWESRVHGRLLLRRVRGPGERHVHSLGEVLGRVDLPRPAGEDARAETVERSTAARGARGTAALEMGRGRGTAGAPLEGGRGRRTAHSAASRARCRLPCG